MKELFWKIGWDNKVKVWTDIWVSGLPHGILHSEYLSDNDKKLEVSSLIVDGRWNLNVIEGRITDEEKEMVLRMAISNELKHDDAVWLKCRDGKYIVKAGYHVAREEEVVAVSKSASSSYQVPSRLWKCIWKLQVPPKVRHFMWKLLSDALATKEAMVRRKCAMEGKCPICDNAIESVEHLILLCPWASRCWFGCSLGLTIDQQLPVSFKKWCEAILLDNKGVTEEGRALIAAICWGIWKGRCDWVFKGIKVDAERVIGMKGSCSGKHQVRRGLKSMWMGPFRRSLEMQG